MVSHLYIHIPYCTSKCGYCDFYSEYPKQEVDDRYINSLLQELKDRYSGEVLSTVFFGGGTPSLLSGAQVNKILSSLSINPLAEITLECNPENLDEKKLNEYKNSGVNRLSIGVQSFFEEKLQTIQRKRSVNVQDKIDTAINIFDNVGIDLIYAIPNQTIQNIADEVSIIPDGVKHVSCYALTIEEGTFFYKKYNGNHPVDDEQQACLSETVQMSLENKEFIRYEISNYAKPGYECKHNLSYWKYENYLGVGAGAVSTISGIRRENTRKISNYLRGYHKDKEYKLNLKDQINEKLLMQARTIYGVPFESRYKEYLEKYSDLLFLKEGRLFFTEKGFLLHDSIIAEMML